MISDFYRINFCQSFKNVVKNEGCLMMVVYSDCYLKVAVIWKRLLFKITGFIELTSNIRENPVPDGSATFAASKYDVHWAGNLSFIDFIPSFAFYVPLNVFDNKFLY